MMYELGLMAPICLEMGTTAAKLGMTAARARIVVTMENMEE